jgi:hypothetical protein
MACNSQAYDSLQSVKRVPSMVALLNHDRRRGLPQRVKAQSRADDIKCFVANDDAVRSAVLGSILKETFSIVTTVHYELKSINHSAL